MQTSGIAQDLITLVWRRHEKLDAARGGGGPYRFHGAVDDLPEIKRLHIEAQFAEYHALLTTNAIFVRRTANIGVLSAEKADEFFEAAWTGDPSSLMADTGWRPATDLAKGLAETSAWYRAEKWI